MVGLWNQGAAESQSLVLLLLRDVHVGLEMISLAWRGRLSSPCREESLLAISSPKSEQRRQHDLGVCQVIQILTPE